MYAKPIALFFLSILLGCQNELVLINDGGGPDGAKCPTVPDMMTTPTAKCAAAKGLPGDVLGDLCIDMDKTDTQGLMARGFNLAAPATYCAAWEVAGGNLQPKGINTALGSVNCALSLPNIPVAAKYSRIMLAVIHRGSMPTGTQARIELPDATPFRIWGSPFDQFDQRTIVEIDTSKIPGGPSLQASIYLFASQNSSMPTWTVSSIAILGQVSQ